MTLLCTPGWVCSSGTSVEVNFGSPNVTARFDVITLITAKANNVTRGFLQCLDEFAMPRGVQIMPKTFTYCWQSLREKIRRKRS